MDINDQGTIHMAKVLIEMGNQAAESERQFQYKIAEVDSANHRIKALEGSLSDARVRYDRLQVKFIEFEQRAEGTINSLKLEREHFTEQNLRLHNELLKWRFKYPRDAKKMRTKPPITRATPPPVSPQDFTVKS